MLSICTDQAGDEIKGNRERYYLSVREKIKSGGEHSYFLLCANCAGLRKLDRIKLQKVEPPVSVVRDTYIVWNTPTSFIVVPKIPWLDDYIKRGKKVFIYNPQTNCVIDYGMKMEISKTWLGFAAVIGITTTPPTEAITEYNL